MNEDVLTNLKSEFKLWGVKPDVNYLNSGHIELVWHATPDKPSRRYIIPKTGSDWRGWLNARSKIRQLFRADGLDLKQEIAKPKPAMQRALSLPEPVERDVDQIKLLRAEVGDLSELLLEMAGNIAALKTQIAEQGQREPVMVHPVPPIAVAPPVPEPPRSMRSIKTVDYVSDGWNSTDAIARDMGVEPKFAYRKLYYLMRQELIEFSHGCWRRKPQVVAPKLSPDLLKLPKIRAGVSGRQHNH